MASKYEKESESLCEPSLEELFAEPIIQLFMKRDGIDANHMRGHFARMERDWAPATA